MARKKTRLLSALVYRYLKYFYCLLQLYFMFEARVTVKCIYTLLCFEIGCANWIL